MLAFIGRALMRLLVGAELFVTSMLIGAALESGAKPQRRRPPPISTTTPLRRRRSRI
jgi:hypothetical protein